MAPCTPTKVAWVVVLLLAGLATAAEGVDSAAQKAAGRSLLSVPAGAPFYAQQLYSKNSVAGGLKVLNAKSGVGTQVVLDDPHGSSIFTVQADGQIQLSSQVNGKTYCLDVSGANYANLASVITWPCNGQTNQNWNFAAQGNNYYSIQPVGNTNFCLDVKGGSTAVGTPIIIFGCNGGSNQAWGLNAGG